MSHIVEEVKGTPNVVLLFSLTMIVEVREWSVGLCVVATWRSGFCAYTTSILAQPSESYVMCCAGVHIGDLGWREHSLSLLLQVPSYKVLNNGQWVAVTS